MKDGFLFGLGFSAAYFLFHYGCQTLIYVASRWQYRLNYKRQMKAIQSGQLQAKEEARPHREYSN